VIYFIRGTVPFLEVLNSPNGMVLNQWTSLDVTFSI